ncbi:uncharacterized protein [Antedon mediterranea]|uniref:uncharacterized protein n=1 Tax=Antedon mediterranea TaxID=105859 RepID=UPI003AF52F49
MKLLYHPFQTKPSNKRLHFTLLTRSTESCLLYTSNVPTFRASYQRGFTTRFLFLVTYLLTSIGITCGVCPLKCVCDDIYLSVKCSNLTKIPTNIPNYTRILLITEGNITQLERTDFLHLPSLRMLSLENNGIHTISGDCFNNTQKLRKLILNGNRLSVFPEALGCLNKLKYLDLMGNDIVNLTTKKPIKLKNLQYLDLESNSLTKVSGEFFKSLSKLRTLNMSNNQIDIIDDDWLRTLSSLEELQMESSFAMPPTIENWFSNKSRNFFSTINLAYNDITSLPARMFNCLPNLNTLIVNNNQISELPSNISLSNLKILELGYNKITHLKTETFESGFNLTKLSLSSNQIERLPLNIFQNSNRLKHVDLKSNLLSTVNLDAFGPLPLLKYLSLAQNRIQVLHPRFPHQYQHLSIFDLSHNRIEVLDEDFFRFNTSLNLLSLSNNYLVKLPDISNLDKLKTLDVSHNLLTFLPIDTFDGTPLQYLDLGYNGFESISWDTLFNLFESGSLETLILEGNPIRCDCYMEWAYHIRSTHPYVWLSNFTCFSPIRFENHGFFQIPDHELYDYLPNCTDDIDTDLITRILIIWFSVMVFLVLVYWIRVYHRSLKLWRAWTRNKHKRKLEASRNKRKSNTFYRISNDNFWNNNNLFTHRMTSSFRRVRLTESLQSNEYLETIV